MTESKTLFFAIRDRLNWSICLGLVTLIGLIYFFAPNHLIENVLNYIWAKFVITIRSLPILGIRQGDLKNLLAAQNEITRQADSWLLFTCISAGVTAAFFSLSTMHLTRKHKQSKQEKVVRGSDFASIKKHNRTMRKKFGKKPPNKMGTPLQMGTDKMIIPESLQYLHFAFCGASGCGKSTAIEEIIEHGLNNGHKGFVIDLGGVFYSKFGRPNDHVLSLRDPRSKRWDFWCEEYATEENIAAALIEEERSGTKFFWTAARGIWASLIRQCQTKDELFLNMMKPGAQLKEELKKLGEISSRVLGEGKGNQADGVLGTSALNLQFLKELNQWNKDEQVFSITQWMKNNTDSSWVYVLVNDRDLDVARPMIRVWFEMASLAVLNRDIGDANKCHTWLIIDELKTVGQLPSLPHLLDKGRKYSASVVLGYQAISQVKRIYGNDDAQSILQGLQNQFFFRMSEVESASYVSETLGDQDVEQPSVSSSFGPGSYGERGSISRSTVRRKLVLADEVRSLETLNAFALLSGQKPVKIKFETKNRAQRCHAAESRINEREVERFTKMLMEQSTNQTTLDPTEPRAFDESHPAPKQESNKALIAMAEGG